MDDYMGPRILHAPADIGGNAFTLSRAERELGLRSDVAVLAGGPYGYGADIRRELAGRSVGAKLAIRAWLVVRALRFYDIIHFNFGQSMVPVWIHGHVANELPILKRAGKTILVTFQGCDVRPVDHCTCDHAYCRAQDRYRAPNARRFLRYADRSFHLNPDLRKWLPGSQFIPYSNVDPHKLLPGEAPAERGEVVVAHAPSNRSVKGTAHVIDAVERLRGDGLAVRLDLIEGVPNAEVIRRVRDADIVVDQLLGAWYGGFAVEAMALAKPVLCHIDEHVPDDNPFGDELPIVRCHPHTLVDRLRELIDSRATRLRIGGVSRTFVERHHDPRKLAAQALSGIVELPARA